MRYALEFARDVAEAFTTGSGIVSEEPLSLCSPELEGYATDEMRREAALRGVLSAEFTEEESTRLLALKPEASEAATFARAMLTAAVRMCSGRRDQEDVDPRMVAQLVLVQFFIFLQPAYAPEDDGVRSPATLH